MASAPRLGPEWVREQELKLHNGQVAGHPGTLQSLKGPNGEDLIVKQSLPKEVAFYEELKSSSAPHNDAVHEFASKWTPKYYGSLNPADGGAGPPRIIIEDLLSGFQRPNVIDIKLGTQLWDEDASQEKRQRMEKASRETTSFEAGIRLTGWRTWDATRQVYVPVSKAFGKSIKADQLQLGLRAFFGLLAGSDTQTFYQLAQETQAIQPSDLPQTVAPQAPDQPLTTELPSTSTKVPNDDITQQRIVSAIRQDLIPALDRLIDLFQRMEIRIRGGSLLIVYEGDLASPTASPTIKAHFIDFAHATFATDHGPDKGILLGLNTISQLLHDITARSQ